MTPDREYELLARIEQLKDQLESVNALYTEQLIAVKEAEGRLGAANREIRDLNRTIGILQDRLRAAQSQGAM